MATYVFECAKCEIHFEKICRFSEADNVKCDTCGGEVKRLLTAPRAVVFTNPKGTSREDNFDYVAKTNYENALQTRRMAEKFNKAGNVYKNIDDSAYEGKIV